MNDNGQWLKVINYLILPIKNLKIGRIDDLISYRLKVEKLIKLKKSFNKNTKSKI